ncbi:MAG: XTP/dITP diphosphatase [Christensenella sp.]|nr:MAG: XTP/dITP diphosphatase [Christensenella sp.]
MKLAIATNNQHKLQEIRAILGDSFEELLSLKDLGIDVDVEETGTTLEENALIKARAILALSGIATLADDTGLMVDALNGAPGVYSARYAGEEHNDAKNRALLLKNLDGVKDRSAHFATVIALCYPDGKTLTASGRVNGEILLSERGTEGFGYDSLFFSTELGKTFAEATQAEKNSVSHRGRALRAMLELVKSQEK